MAMANEELLKSISLLLDNKLEVKFQDMKDYVDSKNIALKNDIHKDMAEFHQEIIEDIGKLDDKISQTNAIVNTQAATIQTLKLKVG